MKSKLNRKGLSPRERRIANLYAEGFSAVQIMVELCEKESTVRAVIQKATQTKG